MASSTVIAPASAPSAAGTQRRNSPVSQRGGEVVGQPAERRDLGGGRRGIATGHLQPLEQRHGPRRGLVVREQVR